MSNFNDKNGHWITTKDGRHIFINEDAIDKQEREIAERKHRTDIATAEHQYSNNLTTNTQSTSAVDYSKIGTRTQAVQQFEQDTGVKIAFDPEDDNICTKTNLYMVLNKVADMKQKYPTQLRFLKSIYSFTDNGIGSRALAQANANDVGINSVDFSKHNPRLQNMYRQMTVGNNNYHPKGTTAEDIITHELGHIMFAEHLGRMTRRLNKGRDFADELDSILWAQKRGGGQGKTAKYVQNEIDQALAKALGSTPQHNVLGYANPKFKHPTAISGYAATNPHELMAEAVADYVANGAKASPLSQELVKILGM